MTSAPAPGEVWEYPYVWAKQPGTAPSDRNKDRPVTVAIAVGRDDGRAVVYLLPVTASEPADTRVSLAVPEIEKHRAGLPFSAPLWVILDEYNADMFEMSAHLSPTTKIGEFSPRFLKDLQRGFRAHVGKGKPARVRRADRDR